MKIALPSNIVSFTAAQVFFQCLGASTAKIIVRVYDSTANLRHESAPLALAGSLTMPYVANTFTSAVFAANSPATVELELQCAPGDTVEVGGVVFRMNLQ